MQQKKPKKPCHSHHFKMSANGKLKVTVTIPPEHARTFVGLANELTDDGCLADFLFETSYQWSKEHLQEEVAKLEAARERTAELQKQLDAHDKSYQEEDKPQMSDEEYDRKVLELEKALYEAETGLKKAE